VQLRLCVLNSLVPQRSPLSPPLLTAAAVLAAAPAAWLALAAEAVATGAIGWLAGFPWHGVAVSPRFLLVTVRDSAGSHAPALWAVALLAGPVLAALVGLVLHVGVEMVRGAAWLRVLALEWVAFATLRLSALLAAGVMPGGRGPVDELYRRLGEPQSGRWSVALLALLALAGAGWLVARVAVEAGRGWMRVDGLSFRRHLVRVVAGYPALASLAAWSILDPWASPGAMAAWLLVTFFTLMGLTR